MRGNEMRWNRVRFGTCRLFSSLLPFLPEPVRHGCDPQILHRLRCTSTTETNSRNRRCCRPPFLSRRFICRKDSIGHELKPEIVWNTLTPMLTHTLPLLRIVQQSGEDGCILSSFVFLRPPANQHPAVRRNQFTLSTHICPDNRHPAGHGFID